MANEITWIMAEFFRGWKRKSGCVTLMLSLVFLAAWMRSGVIRDELSLNPRDNTYSYGEIVSLQGRLSWNRYEAVSTGPPFGASDFPVTLYSRDLREYFQCSPILEDTLVWKWNLAGFGYGASLTHLKGLTVQVWAVPYWAIVLPLTLVSALLMLTKSCKSNLMNAKERISAHGA